MLAKHMPFGLLILALAGTAYGTVPAAPQVTYGAVGVKQLRFDWNYVPKANYYEVWFKANNGAAPAKLGERPSWNPHWVTTLSTHLLNWAEARWEVRACNPSGCTSSGLIDVGDTIQAAVGFIKAPKPTLRMGFGRVVAVSEDGNTLAASCPDKIYVFRRDGGEWLLEGSFVVSATGTDFFEQLSLSADGNVLAVGQFDERWDAANPNFLRGAVSVFRRSGHHWTREARFAEADTFRLGMFMQLDESGTTLAFSLEVPGLTGMRVEIHHRTSAGWTQVAQLDDPTNESCSFGYALSGNGQVLARRCTANGQMHIDTFTAPTWSMRDSFVETTPDPSYGRSWFAIDYTGDVIVGAVLQGGSTQPADWLPETHVFRRNAGTYDRVAVLHPSPFSDRTFGGRSYFGGGGVFVSHDASYIAVVDLADRLGGLVTPPPTSPGPVDVIPGAVYVFEKRGTGYGLRRHVGLTGEPSAAGFDDSVRTPLGFAQDGRTMVLGEAANRSDGLGIAGGRDDASLISAGAVWVY